MRREKGDVARRRRFRHWRRKAKPSRTKNRDAPAPIDVVEHHRRAREFRQRLWENSTSIVTALLFAFVIVKVLLISHGNTATALALISRAGPLSVVGGVLVLGLPFLGTGLANVAAYLAADQRMLDRWEKGRIWTYYAILLFWLSFIVPLFSMLILLVLTAIYAAQAVRRSRTGERSAANDRFEDVLKRTPNDVQLREHLDTMRTQWRRLKQAGKADPPDDAEIEESTAAIEAARQAYNTRVEEIQAVSRPTMDAVAITLLLTSIGPLFHNAINDRPWLPAERVRKTDGSAVIGYVFETNSDWTHILVEDTRLIQIIATEGISAREPCAVAGSSGREARTLWRMFAKLKPGYPACERSPQQAPTPPHPQTQAPTPTQTAPPSRTKPPQVRISSTPSITTKP